MDHVGQRCNVGQILRLYLHHCQIGPAAYPHYFHVYLAITLVIVKQILRLTCVIVR